MVDLEELLRSEVRRRSEELTPPAGLLDTIEARARAIHRRRQRQRLTAGALVASAAVVLAAVLVPGQGDNGDDVRIGHEGPETTTTTRPTTTTSTPPSTTSTAAATSTTTTSAPAPAPPATATTTSPPPAPTSPAVGPGTPLSRSGLGPIRAGMTLREAEAAAGVALTPFDPSVGGTCLAGTVEGTGVQFLAERAGADAGDSVVRTLSRAVEGRTEEGVAIGDPPSALAPAYGPPTRTEPDPDGTGSALQVFESGGYAYAFLINPRAIAVIESGDPAWVGTGDPNGCA
jgi:hypothetical protein